MEVSEQSKKILPRPGRALGHEVVAGDDEFANAEDAFLFEGGDSSRSGDPLDGSFEGFVNLLRQHHLGEITA